MVILFTGVARFRGAGEINVLATVGVVTLKLVKVWVAA
jgi:hypothetical protein